MDHSTRSQHVHFGDELSSPGHNADIQVQIMNQFLIKVHLGFLQVRHRYEIAFNFECPDSMESVFDLQTCGVPGHVRITELKAIQPTTDCQNTLHKCTCVLYAYKEKLLKEKVFLQSKSQRTQSLTFIFMAEYWAMEKDALLKQGIKCIGFDDDNQDEEEEEEKILTPNQQQPIHTCPISCLQYWIISLYIFKLLLFNILCVTNTSDECTLLNWF